MRSVTADGTVGHAARTRAGAPLLQARPQMLNEVAVVVETGSEQTAASSLRLVGMRDALRVRPGS